MCEVSAYMLTHVVSLLQHGVLQAAIFPGTANGDSSSGSCVPGVAQPLQSCSYATVQVCVTISEAYTAKISGNSTRKSLILTIKTYIYRIRVET